VPFTDIRFGRTRHESADAEALAAEADAADERPTTETAAG
jgi:hypothetical protein